MSEVPQAHVQMIDGKPRIRWGDEGNCYHLLRLAKNGFPLKLPPVSDRYDADTLFSYEKMIIFGERSGGGRDFFDWLRKALEDKGAPWVLVEGDRWQKELVQYSDSEPDAGNLNALADSILALVDKTAAEGANDLVAWAKNQESRAADRSARAHLLIRDLAQLPDAKGSTVAQALRIAFDTDNKMLKEHLTIVLLSTSEYQLEDTYYNSGLAPMCDRFRLPWLQREEIRMLAESEFFDLKLDEDSLREVVVATGGQPALTQALLEKMVEHKEVGVRYVRGAFNSLRQFPPMKVAVWQEDLRMRLGNDRELLQAMKAYILGASRSKEQSIPASHMHLYYPGWIRFDTRMMRWKISSKLHTEYAQEAIETEELL